MKPPPSRGRRGASDPGRWTGGDGRTEGADVRVIVRVTDMSNRHAAPARGAGPSSRRPVPPPDARSRRWGVERPDVAFPFRADGDDPRVTTSGTGETLRAVVALAAGVSLAVLSYLQFRGARADATALVAAVAEAAAEPSSTAGAAPIELPAVVTDAVAGMTSPESTPASGVRDDATVAAPVRERLTRLAASVIDEMRAADTIDEPAAVEPASADAEPATEARPQPATLIDERSSVEATPAMIPAARIDPAPADEDHIRATLARWRTAYSQLDARAAREIWPSVDVSALERAFQALKSQDLRFDRCDLTVTGGRAQAACRGRAVYVPRVGNQSPRATPREWTFELKKLDQGWTIASARAS